jgi:hypothetical protein
MAEFLKRRIKRVPHSDRGRSDEHPLILRFPSSSSLPPPPSSSSSATSSSSHRGSVIDFVDGADMNDPLTLAIRRESILRVPFEIRHAVLREFQEKRFHIGLKKVRLHKHQMAEWRTDIRMAVARYRMAINREQRSREIFLNIGKQEVDKEKKPMKKVCDVVVHKRRDDDESQRETHVDKEVIKALEKGQLYDGSVCHFDDDDDDGAKFSSQRNVFMEIQKKCIQTRPITPRQTMFPSKAEVRVMVEEGVRRTTEMLTKKLKDRDPTLTEILHPTTPAISKRIA